MSLKTLKDIDVAGKTVLYRSPYDIGTKEENGKYVIKDDSRITATLPTLEYLIDKGCKIVILTWVKRPNGKVVENLRTNPHAEALSKLLGRTVKKVDECVGTMVENEVKNLKPGEMLMLENTRFHPEEDANNDEFARQLAKLGEVIVFDGFPQAHREHASTTGILRHTPGVAGFYFEKEYESLKKLVVNPQHPFTAIIGGAKISDKVDAINNLYDLVDIFLVGGGPANVFLKAEGKNMGNSFIEDIFVDSAKKEKKDWVEYAREIKAKNTGMKSYENFNISESISLHKIQTPYDLVIGNDVRKPTEHRVVTAHHNEEVVPNGWAALDIGPKAQQIFSEIILQSNTVFWNGPVGTFENEFFDEGSKAVAKAMEQSQGTTIVAGGDTIEAAKKFCDISKISHISLAGGATLEFLAGKKLPVVEMLLK